MLIGLRLRRLLVPLAFHAAAAATSGYFVWHAVNGQRGLKTSLDYEKQIAELQSTLDQVRSDRDRWTRRIALIKGDAIDRDTLEEESRLLLGRSHKYDIVIFQPDKPTR